MPQKIDLDTVIIFIKGKALKTNREALSVLLDCASIGLEGLEPSGLHDPSNAKAEDIAIHEEGERVKKELYEKANGLYQGLRAGLNEPDDGNFPDPEEDEEEKED